MTGPRSQDDFEVPPGAEAACDELLALLRTTFQRLETLSSLRRNDPPSYSSPALDGLYPADVVSEVLVRRHEQTFREWLSLGLEHQYAQLAEFLASHEGERSRVIFAPSSLIPAAATDAERALFLDDFKLLLGLMNRN